MLCRMTATPENADNLQLRSAIDATPDIHVPAGFRFAATAGGIKPSGKPDCSIVAGRRDLTAAGVYTTNQVVAAAVHWCRDRTPASNVRAVATVSGNANACTGETGRRDNRQIAEIVAESIGCDPDQVLVMSTGIIGRTLPMDKVHAGLQTAAAGLSADDATSPAAAVAVANAIRTTDDGPKYASRQIELSTGTTTITAMCKGAGMIAPNMATLLAMAMTDAPLRPTQCDEILRRVADRSFNRITVDGHASTNDTLLLLSSGATDGPLSAEDLQTFEHTLTELSVELGKRIVADGEGASSYMALTVTGAADDNDAETIARHTAQSLLVKTAITGNDPNWGRIVSAAGAAGPPIDVHQTSLEICGTRIYDRGTPVDFDEPELSRSMAEKTEIPIHLTVGPGPGTAQIYASDLTTHYVTFNSEYTT